jgi:hypothetical protein
MYDALLHVDSSLRTNRPLVLTAARIDGEAALMFADKSLRADREIVLEAVRQNGIALCCASRGLRSDPEVVLAAVQQNGKALQYASAGLLGHCDFTLACIRAMVPQTQRLDGCKLVHIVLREAPVVTDLNYLIGLADLCCASHHAAAAAAAASARLLTVRCARQGGRRSSARGPLFECTLRQEPPSPTPSRPPPCSTGCTCTR